MEFPSSSVASKCGHTSQGIVSQVPAEGTSETPSIFEDVRKYWFTFYNGHLWEYFLNYIFKFLEVTFICI